MSPIESLPVEIIEMIFFECLNPNLPRASLRIGAALSTFRTKITLLRKAFSGHATYSNELYSDDSCVLQTAETYDTVSMIGKLQSDILNCRWMTWDFLRSYMEISMTDSIFHVFRSQNISWQDSESLEYSAVRQFVHDILYRDVEVSFDSRNVRQWNGHPMTLDDVTFDHFREFDKDFKILLAPEPSREKAGVVTTKNQEPLAADQTEYSSFEPRRDHLWVRFENEDVDLGRVVWYQQRFRTTSLVTRGWALNDEKSEVAIVINPRTGVVLIATCPGYQEVKTGFHGRRRLETGYFGRWRSLVCYRGTCQIPEKILKEPWTRDKLNFLEAVLEAGCCVTNKERIESAEYGLMDAIHSDDYGAVDLIASESVDAQRTQLTYTGAVYVEPSYCDGDLNSQLYRPSVLGIRPRRTVNISPATEHLKAAVLERGCRKMIVRRLLFARSDQVNRQDQAIAAWIEEKIDIGDEKGEWLQCQLDRSAYLQSLTKEELGWEL